MVSGGSETVAGVMRYLSVCHLRWCCQTSYRGTSMFMGDCAPLHPSFGWIGWLLAVGLLGTFALDPELSRLGTTPTWVWQVGEGPYWS